MTNQNKSESSAVPLAVRDFAPRSMLHAPEPQVPRARLPVIDGRSHPSNTRRSERAVALGKVVNLWMSSKDALGYDERGWHPGGSLFTASNFPNFQQLLVARDRIYAPHPRTQLVSLQVGHRAENVAALGDSLERLPNTSFEPGARTGELGRLPRSAGRFFEKYQDRILFGTDPWPAPKGKKYPRQVCNDELYEIHFRFLESPDQ